MHRGGLIGPNKGQIKQLIVREVFSFSSYSDHFLEPEIKSLFASPEGQPTPVLPQAAGKQADWWAVRGLRWCQAFPQLCTAVVSHYLLLIFISNKKLYN